MSEEGKKKRTGIKATIGAWWKSTSGGGEKSAPAESAEEEKKSSAEPAARTGKKAAAAPKKSDAGKGSAAKKSETAVKKSAPRPKNEEESSGKGGGSRKSGGSRGGSRRSRSSAAGKKEADNSGLPGAVEEPGSEKPAADPGDAAGGETEKPAEETAKKRGRGLRSQRSAAKAATTADSEQKSGSDKEAEGDEEPRRALKLLINAEEPEECRLALLESGRLDSIHVSTAGREQRKSNIYKARVVAVEPSLQAAFIDYGTEKNGFLPFGEIHPEYFKTNLSDEVREKVEKQQWKKLNITDVIERGQELLAQVVKEEVGRKGANMTTFLSIPGRCVVLMPGSDSSGISRRISGEQRRGELREIMNGFDIPEGIGWIVRTASSGITENALTRDVEYLLRLWQDIRAKGQSMKGVGLLYEDHRTVSRFLREHFDPAIEEILVDDRTALEQVKEFLEMQPRSQRTVRVRLHQGARPIFNHYSVEDQIEQIYQSQVSLPSGGSIVIDPTEALVAIDVNSGSTSKGANFEESIFQANMEAATELARQLRLRDLGGLVVVDFIDMRSRKHINAVEKQVKQAMKRDKAKVDFSRISKFGLMEISRQKLGAPIEAGNYQVCEYCRGRGKLRSVETLSLFYLRRIQTGASRKPVARVECRLPLDVASYLLNHKRGELCDMEKRYDVGIEIIGNSQLKPNDHEIVFHKKEQEQRRPESKNRKK